MEERRATRTVHVSRWLLPVLVVEVAMERPRSDRRCRGEVCRQLALRKVSRTTRERERERLRLRLSGGGGEVGARARVESTAVSECLMVDLKRRWV